MRRLRVGEALCLGALHGPAELLPISSSAHVELVPWLLGWEYAELDPELRKAFEVAVHAGTAAALLIALRDEVGDAVTEPRPRGAASSCSGPSCPPAAVGCSSSGRSSSASERRAAIAVGLLAGAFALAVADGIGPTDRHRDEAGAADALALGIAQALALVPGVSRNGATLAAARLRGFPREDANGLSRHVALPIIAGATALKAVRLARRGPPPGAARGLAAGVLAAFASTLVVRRLVRDDRALWPWAAYRSVLAAVVWRRASSQRRA